MAIMADRGSAGRLPRVETGMSSSTLTRPTRSSSVLRDRAVPAHVGTDTVGTYTGTPSSVGSYTGTASVVGTYTGTRATVGSYVRTER